MPQYKVLAKGFFNGEVYKPGGKRSVLRTEKPFPSKGKTEQVPSWLERIKDETPAQVKKRKATEAKAAKADAAKAEQDKTDVDAVTFLDDNKTPSSAVETLG